jgi:DnaK suppressor protein
MPEEQAKVRAALQARLRQIEAGNALGKEDRAIVGLDQQSVGRLSRMDALQRKEMASANERRRATEAQRLRDALARLEEGEYGFCQECGEEIAPARLALDPAAALCISCARG